MHRPFQQALTYKGQHVFIQNQSFKGIKPGAFCSTPQHTQRHRESRRDAGDESGTHFLILSKVMHLMSAGNGAALRANTTIFASSAEALATRKQRGEFPFWTTASSSFTKPDGAPTFWLCSQSRYPAGSSASAAIATARPTRQRPLE